MPIMEQRGFLQENIDDPSDLYRELIAIKNRTQRKIVVKNGYPHLDELENGTMTIRDVRGQGMYIFVKHNNKLYNTRLAEEGRTGVSKLTDSTGGTISDTLDCTTTTAGQDDDLASLVAKVNEIIGKL